MQAILLGSPDTKRTIYFTNAARETGLHLLFWDWDRKAEWEKHNLSEQNQVLKIDPPRWNSCVLEELHTLTEGYSQQLSQLSALPVNFLNHPNTIAALLNKRDRKNRLSQKGLPVTEAMDECINSADGLLTALEQYKWFQVFIKPNFGSGAAGVAAFRFQPRTGRMVLYTCALEDPASKQLVNTKRLRRFDSREQILPLLNRVLALDCIVERWYPKAEYQDYSYDLRAVVQDGQMDFLLSRLSKGPITNLHLNNHPLPASQLNLTEKQLADIRNLCCQAMQCYPGLRSAGIDILLERGNQNPRIIEMNGQGDLIYQDIFHENLIYRHQAEMMRGSVLNH